MLRRVSAEVICSRGPGWAGPLLCRHRCPYWDNWDTGSLAMWNIWTCFFMITSRHFSDPHYSSTSCLSKYNLKFLDDSKMKYVGLSFLMESHATVCSQSRLDLFFCEKQQLYFRTCAGFSLLLILFIRLNKMLACFLIFHICTMEPLCWK